VKSLSKCALKKTFFPIAKAWYKSLVLPSVVEKRETFVDSV
jgi:hypothetical protein